MVLYKFIVKFWPTSRRQRKAGRFAVAGLMLGLWLVTFAMTVSPQLHRWLHDDAQSAGHHCLVTQLQQGPLLAGLAPALMPSAPLMAVPAPGFPEFQFFSDFDYRLSPSRAPPSLIPTTTVVG